MTKEKDYYTLLGIQKTASQDEIKAAYRTKALQLHPDRNPNDAIAEKEFRQITNAYEVLKDSYKRQAYDSLRNRERDQDFDTRGGTGSQYSQSKSGPKSPVDHDFDEWLRKWMRDNGYTSPGQQKHRQWRSPTYAEKVASWEEQKQEARIQKERDFRMRQRVANRRAARQAATLQKFWQTSPGLTWQDGVMLSLMSMIAVSSIWLLWPSERPRSQEADIEVLQHNRQ